MSNYNATVNFSKIIHKIFAIVQLFNIIASLFFYCMNIFQKLDDKFVYKHGVSRQKVVEHITMDWILHEVTRKKNPGEKLKIVFVHMVRYSLSMKGDNFQ